mmetsp:Transcript_30013/g.27440  ORF Transcript_30013/g.27440 Transcript_30013/m.27440 type:complete len:92 (+) Transcript_30013:49-324(+)
MAKEEEKKKDGDGEDDDDDKPKEPEKGCCEKTGDCILATCRFIYAVGATVGKCIIHTVGFCWYPIKERCHNCCYRIKLKFNPALDPAYSEL